VFFYLKVQNNNYFIFCISKLVLFQAKRNLKIREPHSHAKILLYKIQL
jgi:hypothetical protein